MTDFSQYYENGLFVILFSFFGLMMFLTRGMMKKLLNKKIKKRQGEVKRNDGITVRKENEHGIFEGKDNGEWVVRGRKKSKKVKKKQVKKEE